MLISGVSKKDINFTKHWSLEPCSKDHWQDHMQDILCAVKRPKSISKALFAFQCYL